MFDMYTDQIQECLKSVESTYGPKQNRPLMLFNVTQFVNECGLCPKTQL